MHSDVWELIAADKAPWWWAGILGLVGAVIGGFIGSLTAKASDERRSSAEVDRLEVVREQEREQYLRNRLLDEVGLLVGAVESLRLHLLTGFTGLARAEDGKFDREDEENIATFYAVFDKSDSVIHALTVQVARVLMITSGDLADAVRRIDTASRGFYTSAFETKAKYDGAHDEVGESVAVLITAMRTEIGVADPESEPVPEATDSA